MPRASRCATWLLDGSALTERVARPKPVDGAGESHADQLEAGIRRPFPCEARGLQQLAYCFLVERLLGGSTLVQELALHVLIRDQRLCAAQGRAVAARMARGNDSARDMASPEVAADEIVRHPRSTQEPRMDAMQLLPGVCRLMEDRPPVVHH